MLEVTDVLFFNLVQGEAMEGFLGQFVRVEFVFLLIVHTMIFEGCKAS